MTKILQKKAFLWAGQLINRRIEIKCQQIITDKKTVQKWNQTPPKNLWKKFPHLNKSPKNLSP